MKKIILLSLIFFGIEANAGDTVTCTLTATKSKKSISASLPLSAANEDGIESNGEGLDIGKDNYNFIMGLSRAGGDDYEIDATFYENNNVQDEVGSLKCKKFNPTKKSFTICEEPITNEKGKTIANFICTYQ